MCLKCIHGKMLIKMGMVAARKCLNEIFVNLKAIETYYIDKCTYCNLYLYTDR